jgi:hypothetical protein
MIASGKTPKHAALIKNNPLYTLTGSRDKIAPFGVSENGVSAL